jgi:hypothetical protein
MISYRMMIQMGRGNALERMPERPLTAALPARSAGFQRR